MTSRIQEAGEGVVPSCRYVPAYQSRCGAPVVEGQFCEKHRGIRCGVCGEQAVTECSHTGQFVCGTPLCDACEGFTDATQPNGNWGFANHSHRPIVCDTPRPTKSDADGGRDTTSPNDPSRLSAQALSTGAR
ncbi:hypothetical protein ASG52_19740 [Methylobacterium sp. Leaf456]|uniref:hypothetical protein n=1 Tax=Methylobacterium sp. Leaf456 TaxID=1736382 RepID=UPI0006F9C1ED|nr:hypothetical protein [Methylobacterium sp. Leaf456]KQT59960.1 hypothetical protein ASG52_19740 [Methylobacterium sp. Leaf456]